MVLQTVEGVGPGTMTRVTLRASLIPFRLRSVSFVSFRLHCRYAVAAAAAAVPPSLTPMPIPVALLVVCEGPVVFVCRGIVTAHTDRDCDGDPTSMFFRALLCVFVI